MGADAAGRSRGGVTLTELLVAAALSLVVMGAVASLFGILMRSIRQSQATVDLSALMRSAAWQLRQDLTGITCTVAPWISPETNSGYFELIEGPNRDISFAFDAQGLPTSNLTADTDDILLFTTQSLAGPFIGRYEAAMVESPYAEVAWFCRPAASQPIRQSQATVDLSALMRSAAWQLRQDLTGITCTVAPWISPETNSGYFELIEGPNRDISFAFDAQGLPTSNLTADTDDILLFTTQSLAGPFIGRYEAAMVESPYAEVAWFCRPAASQPVAGTTLYDLHRRQLLVTSYLGQSALVNNALPITANRAAYDVSLHADTIAGQGNVLLPNSLSDLTKREYRFMRSGYSFVTGSGQTRSVPGQMFPFAFPLVGGTSWALADATLNDTTRVGEDVILTNVIAFDVRVYDPQAVVPTASGTTWRLPGDPGYLNAVASGTAGTGAYVDLGWRGGTPVLRTGTFPPAGQSALGSTGVFVTDVPRKLALPAATYDTWSRHYEFNGVDDDGDGVVDEGSNGADTDGDGWPEHSGNTETSPPYPAPLRGVEVRLRCYEPHSNQVRQITIRHSFKR